VTLHVLQHLLQRVQHLLRFGHAAFLHQLLDPAQHLVEVGHRHLGALALVGLVGVDRPAPRSRQAGACNRSSPRAIPA
jgi:hypothetical protein